MKNEMHLLCLSWEQFDALEEAADIMALGHRYVDTMEEAVHYLAARYVEQEGPKFEACWTEEEPPTPCA